MMIDSSDQSYPECQSSYVQTVPVEVIRSVPAHDHPIDNSSGSGPNHSSLHSFSCCANLFCQTCGKIKVNKNVKDVPPSFLLQSIQDEREADPRRTFVDRGIDTSDLLHYIDFPVDLEDSKSHEELLKDWWWLRKHYSVFTDKKADIVSFSYGSNSSNCKTEKLSWHKCCKNDSVIHSCKKCTSSLEKVNHCNCFSKTNYIREDFSPTKKNNESTCTRVSRPKSEEKDSNNCDRIPPALQCNVECLGSKLFWNYLSSEFDIHTPSRSSDEKSVVLPRSIEDEYVMNVFDCQTNDPDKEKTLANANILNIPKKSEQKINDNNINKKNEDVSSTHFCNKSLSNDDSKKIDIPSVCNLSNLIVELSLSAVDNFLEIESDESWSKSAKGNYFDDSLIGKDKEVNTMFVLGELNRYRAPNYIGSCLTRRQKRYLATSIVEILEMFNLKSKGWIVLSKAIIENINETLGGRRSETSEYNHK